MDVDVSHVGPAGIFPNGVFADSARLTEEVADVVFRHADREAVKRGPWHGGAHEEVRHSNESPEQRAKDEYQFPEPA